ncbi:hypothetical protein LUZ61_019932 [Rhynchospora tenuis]|uniref:F-box domain-containing protein n=1 Tax=Rhynchospora tenuis TaxID=198213 RepID=A0AAD6ENB7_9POAL|nr:hypothetical protein LUZ61_019932 [Rhynchospora tenuis]
MTGADRISELHDSILTHILSYLPTKEAVQTQRLSKRWRNVWAFVPVLDFDNGNFSSDDIYLSRQYTAYVQAKFVEFIDAVLASRQVQRISCGNLKSLVINGCYHSTEIKVSIPSLQYLKVTVMSSQTAGYVFKNMSSLVKACICLLAMNEMLILNRGAKILEGLLGVTALDIVLCGLDAKDMLKHIFKNCPYFENLKFMHFESFDGCMTGCIDTMDRLVQHSPALKEMTVYDCQDDADGKIDLIEELRKLLGEYGILVERHQGSTCGSLSKLKKLLREHLYLVELIGWAAVHGKDGEGEEERAGVWWEDEEGNEGEASSAEEEEEGGEETNELMGGSMEEGEEMEEEEDDE